MELVYKIGIVVLAFSIIFLTGLAGQLLKQDTEKSQLQR
jgi:hypothetical protein